MAHYMLFARRRNRLRLYVRARRMAHVCASYARVERLPLGYRHIALSSRAKRLGLSHFERLAWNVIANPGVFLWYGPNVIAKTP